MWSQEASKAFAEVKKHMVSAPVLRLPDFSKPFEVECDGSSKGIDAILL